MSPIPAEIVILALVIWLGFKAVRGWARSTTLGEENARLKTENEQLKQDLAAFADGRMEPLRKSKGQ